MKYHHSGIAVRNIKDLCGEMGWRVPEIIPDPIQRANVAFLDATTELVEPLDNESPVWRFVSASLLPYHDCFTVRDIDRAIQNARLFGAYVISEPVPAPAFDGRRIAWILNKSGELIELLEASH